MITPIPENESERLLALASYNILDTEAEQDFDDLTLLASEICQTPIALVSLIDDKRQWVKSGYGVTLEDIPREYAFCAHAIVNAKEVMVINDTREDERFYGNPLVARVPGAIFYAGVPLLNEDGHALGSLCVIDHQPKELSAEQLKSLRILAKQVLTQMELRRKLSVIKKANEELVEVNSSIQNFAKAAAHDIKSPLSSIMLTSQALQMRLKDTGDARSRNLVDLTISSSKKLMTLVDEMLEYSTVPGLLFAKQEPVQLNKLLTDVIEMIYVPVGIKINLPLTDHMLNCSSIALEQIFLNLLTNAVRYNDKAEGVVSITFNQDDEQYSFSVADNGIGIAEGNLEKIFRKDVILNMVDRFNKKGTGLGLYTVKSLVEKLQGGINVHSAVGEGATFKFHIKKRLS